MKRTSQLIRLNKADVFGGSLLKGNAKTKRFIPRKLPLHIVLKSEMAVQKYSMIARHRLIRDLIQRQARLAGVKLYDFVNMGNHIHILAQFHSRFSYHRFIRSITGLIARVVLDVQRGSGLPNEVKFWSYRPYTRILHPGRRSLENLKTYMAKNRAQLFGVSRKQINTKDPVAMSFLEIMKTWDAALTQRVLC